MILTMQAVSLSTSSGSTPSGSGGCRADRVRLQHPVAPPRPPRRQRAYLDRNYGGILIIWDRIFGTFQGEDGAAYLRADEEHPHLQTRSGSPSTSSSRWRATCATPRAGATASATCSAGPAGRRTGAAGAPAAERAEPVQVSRAVAVGTNRAMGLPLLLIVIGIVLAILVHYALGIVLHPRRTGAADRPAPLRRRARRV